MHMKNPKRVLASAATALLTVSMLSACDKLEEDLNETASSGIESRAAEYESEMVPGCGPKQHPVLPIFAQCEAPEHPDCVEVVESGEGYPKTITITRSASCENDKGDGSATITISGDMKTAGSVQTMKRTRSGDRGTMESTTVITNTGQNKDGDYVFSIEQSKSADGERGGMSRSYKGTAVMVEGYDTETCDDDVFIVNGTGSGSVETPRGTHEMEETFTDVRIDRGCEHPTAGVIEKSGGRGDVTIDFGEGACDEVAQLTRDGETEEVNLNEMPNRGHDDRPGRGRRGHR